MVNLGKTVFTVVLHLKPWLALFFVPSWFLYCQYISWIIKYALVNCRVMEFRLGIKKTNGNAPGRLTMKELDKIANIQVNCEHALQILVDFFAVINNHGKETSPHFSSLFAQWPLHSLLSSAMKRDQVKRDYTVSFPNAGAWLPTPVVKKATKNTKKIVTVCKKMTFFW